MKTFTIFTPTYNRAYIIEQLYDSLKKQTSNNFEWLIIDDGSTDNTESLVQDFIKENKISINYIKQKNQGKHIAINTSIKYIKSEYLITVDSDDYLLPHAISTCESIVNEINDKNEVAGFTFFNYLGKNDLDFSLYGKNKSYKQEEINLKIPGEMNIVFKKQILSNYLFPVYNDEKFCQESYIIVQIMDRYKILFTDHILERGQYLEDGLTQNIYKRLLENPKYALATLKIKYKSSHFSKIEKKGFAINFWDITLKTQAVHPLTQLFNFPLKGTLVYINYRICKFCKI